MTTRTRTAEHQADYYLLNAYAGEALSCPTIASTSGYLWSDASWLDDSIDLSAWGLDISANCNLGEYDPIPLHYADGPRTTTGTNVLHNHTEDGTPRPVLCMEIYDRDGDTWHNGDDCDDRNPDRYPGAEEIPNGRDDNCDGQIDEGIVGESCATLKATYPDAPDGVYRVDPDGQGAFPVYCFQY